MINIPTELLRTFVTAMEMGSFTRAGEAVGRTQSAVSLQIRRLEEMLDAQLFVRGTHRMRLTDLGNRYSGSPSWYLAVTIRASADSVSNPLAMMRGVAGVTLMPWCRNTGRRT